jgi:hypothetical protein
MPSQRVDGAIRVLDAKTPSRSAGGPTRLLFVVLVLALVGAAVVLSMVPVTESTEALDPLVPVRQLRDAIDAGAGEEVLGVLADDAILTWPAGPPWGGPLSWSVELVTGAGHHDLSQHVADLDDFLAFYETLNGSTQLLRCNIADRPELAAVLFDSWVTCDFSLANDLMAAMDAQASGAVGQMTFGVADDKVTSVLVDSWDVTVPPFAYIRWIHDRRPDQYAALFSGRVTLPKYGVDTAEELLDLASEFAAG